jgi:hypothetical protein
MAGLAGFRRRDEEHLDELFGADVLGLGRVVAGDPVP